MGIYMSVACDEVELEEGSGNGVKYAVGEMQGWRKSMEDAHITIANLNEIVTHDVNIPMSLFGVFDGHGGKEVAKFAKLKYAHLLAEQLASKGSNIEAALKESFHRVDMLLEDQQFDGLLRELSSIPNPADVKRSPNTVKDDLESPSPDNNKKALTTHQAVDLIRNLLLSAKLPAQPTDWKLDDDDDEESFLAAPAPEQQDEMEVDAPEHHAFPDDSLPEQHADEEVSMVDACISTDADRTSNALIVLPEGDAMDGGEPSSPISEAKADSDFQKLRKPLKLNLSQDDSNIGTHSHTMMNGGAFSTSHYVSPYRSADDSALDEDREVLVASRQTPNGPVCNLPPHRVIAGCTAIVALVYGDKIYTANAGDSRGVLCRENGVAYGLSEDHKPSQSTELTRINSAGGFVNKIGRVNGNLNLTRSLGDLKYKQLYHLTREEQIISADPDITVTAIEPTDRFFILGCDGIWDCLTNQEACDFVSQRLEQGMEVPRIVEEMCHHCLASDPRATAGIGGDNMTCLIVLLNQKQ